MSASTTGNISGVYDTSGGAWDYVAGVIKTENGIELYVSLSGFDQTELNQIGRDGKYLDVYDYGTTWQDRSRGHLGDATTELGPFNSDRSAWYDDDAQFISGSYSWFTRGADWDSTTGSGPLAYGRNTGGTYSGIGSRIVIL